MPQSQTAALHRPQEEEETDKSKQAETEQTYEKHIRLALSSPSEVIAILKGLNIQIYRKFYHKKQKKKKKKKKLFW